MGVTYFVDETTGNNADSGLTMDDAWETLEYALLAGSPVLKDDIIWVRRLQNETPTIAWTLVVVNATFKEPVRVIGWARTAHTIASSDWVNGSTAVVIDDADMSRTKHQGRYITAPDGNIYLITRVVDASNIVIDRAYLGANANNQEAIISADEDYAEAQTINDSGWTINKAIWNADADDLASVNWNGLAQTINMKKNWWFANMEFRESAHTHAMIKSSDQTFFKMVGCLFYENYNTAALRLYKREFPLFLRCIFEGSGAGAAQVCFYNGGDIFLRLRDCAIYNFGDHAILQYYGHTRLDNVNIGVELPNGDDEFTMWRIATIKGKDVRLGGTNGIVNMDYQTNFLELELENYGKLKGTHKRWVMHGEITKVAADGAGDSPNQRSGGAENVIEILYNRTNVDVKEARRESAVVVRNYEFDVDTSTKTYRIYIQSMANLTADEIWLELDYISENGDTSKTTRVYSDESVNVRANQNDWTQYIEIPDITPAVASRIRLRCFCGYFHASNKIFIDPGNFKYLPMSLIDFPTEGDVEKGVNFDVGNKTGTFKVPAIGDVEKGVQYGEDDVEFTGTFKAPAAVDVRDGEGYGEDDTEFIGELDLSEQKDVRAGVIYDSETKEGALFLPAESNVRKPVGYGEEGTEFEGTVIVPGKADVREGEEVDVSDIGELDLPAIADVEKGVKYDSLTKEGTFKAPAQADVRDGKGYGAGDVEFEGELDLPTEGDVEKGVQYDSLTKTGTFKIPIKNDVRKNKKYGKDDVEFTGKATVPGKADVRKNVDVDVSDIGLLDLPVIADVEEGVKFDNETKIGDFKVPIPAQVEKDVQYGAAGTEFTGTLIGILVFRAEAVGKLQKSVSIKGIFQEGG